MTSTKKWFVVVNPTSGNGAAKKLWPKIEQLLLTYGINFEYAFTEHQRHSIELIQSAIYQYFTSFICVGGDGTLHNMVNGIMSQDGVVSTNIAVGVIPIGTGNDWVKTYAIPKDIETAIQIIKNGNTKEQDIGKIELLNQNMSAVYFNNLAGVGFDGFVVSKMGKYKRFGAVAYIVGTIMGMFAFKNFETEISVNTKTLTTKSLMILIGLCKYSGGGMQLTKDSRPSDGLFDVTIAEKFSKWDIVKNMSKLFNGNIVNFKKVQTFKTESITVKILQEDKPFIQADGELIGSGDFKISMLPNAFSFYSK